MVDGLKGKDERREQKVGRVDLNAVGVRNSHLKNSPLEGVKGGVFAEPTTCYTPLAPLVGGISSLNSTTLRVALKRAAEDEQASSQIRNPTSDIESERGL